MISGEVRCASGAPVQGVYVAGENGVAGFADWGGA
jgi:hypothetical protein